MSATTPKMDHFCSAAGGPILFGAVSSNGPNYVGATIESGPFLFGAKLKNGPIRSAAGGPKMSGEVAHFGLDINTSGVSVVLDVVFVIFVILLIISAVRTLINLYKEVTTA